MLTALSLKLRGDADASGAHSPALARAWGGDLSPCSSRSKPRSNWALSPRAQPLVGTGTGAGVSVVWALGSATKAAAYESPLRATSRGSPLQSSAASQRSAATRTRAALRHSGCAADPMTRFCVPGFAPCRARHRRAPRSAAPSSRQRKARPRLPRHPPG